MGPRPLAKIQQMAEIVNRAMVLCTDDKDYGRNLFRAAFGPYYATPCITTSLRGQGTRMPLHKLPRVGREDRNKTAAAMSDEMIDEIAIIGNEDEIQQRIQATLMRHRYPIIAPLAGNREDVDRTFARLPPKNSSFLSSAPCQIRIAGCDDRTVICFDTVRPSGMLQAKCRADWIRR